MAKSNLSKKALINNLLVCILYHNIKIDLLRLLEKLKNSKIKILIVVDGKLIIKNKKKIQEMFVNIKFLYVKKNKQYLTKETLVLNMQDINLK